MFAAAAASSPNAVWNLTGNYLSNNVAGAPTISSGALTGTGGTLGNNLAAATTFSIGALGASTTFGGTIANSSGTTAIVTVGSGSLTLTGTNTYTGGTTLTSGLLVLGFNAAGAGEQYPFQQRRAHAGRRDPAGPGRGQRHA